MNKDCPKVGEEVLCEEVQIFINELKTWLRTPYKKDMAEKGLGADCTNFMLKAAIDVFPDIKKTAIFPVRVGKRNTLPNIPDYIHYFDPEERILYRKSDLEYKEGDVVIFKMGSRLAHCAVYIGGKNKEFIHCLGIDGVRIVSPPPEERAKIFAVYRLRRFEK
jgi:cell wall-associated NlpC family hydrolase